MRFRMNMESGGGCFCFCFDYLGRHVPCSCLLQSSPAPVPVRLPSPPSLFDEAQLSCLRTDHISYERLENVQKWLLVDEVQRLILKLLPRGTPPPLPLYTHATTPSLPYELLHICPPFYSFKLFFFCLSFLRDIGMESREEKLSAVR